MLSWSSRQGFGPKGGSGLASPPGTSSDMEASGSPDSAIAVLEKRWLLKQMEKQQRDDQKSLKSGSNFFFNSSV